MNEVSLMAGNKNNSGVSVQMRQRCFQQVELGVAIQSHGIVGLHARFHSTRGVHHENVDFSKGMLCCRKHLLHGVVVGEIRADGHGLAAVIKDFVGDLESA